MTASSSTEITEESLEVSNREATQLESGPAQTVEQRSGAQISVERDEGSSKARVTVKGSTAVVKKALALLKALVAFKAAAVEDRPVCPWFACGFCRDGPKEECGDGCEGGLHSINAAAAMKAAWLKISEQGNSDQDASCGRPLLLAISCGGAPITAGLASSTGSSAASLPLGSRGCSGGAGTGSPEEELLELCLVAICPTRIQEVGRFHRYVRPSVWTEQDAEMRQKYAPSCFPDEHCALGFTDVIGDLLDWLPSILRVEIDDMRPDDILLVSARDWEIQSLLPRRCNIPQPGTVDIALQDFFFKRWCCLKDVFRSHFSLPNEAAPNSLRAMSRHLGLPPTEQGRKSWCLDEIALLTRVTLDLLKQDWKPAPTAWREKAQAQTQFLLPRRGDYNPLDDAGISRPHKRSFGEMEASDPNFTRPPILLGHQPPNAMIPPFAPPFAPTSGPLPPMMPFQQAPLRPFFARPNALPPSMLLLHSGPRGSHPNGSLPKPSAPWHQNPNLPPPPPTLVTKAAAPKQPFSKAHLMLGPPGATAETEDSEPLEDAEPVGEFLAETVEISVAADEYAGDANEDLDKDQVEAGLEMLEMLVTESMSVEESQDELLNSQSQMLLDSEPKFGNDKTDMNSEPEEEYDMYEPPPSADRQDHEIAAEATGDQNGVCMPEVSADDPVNLSEASALGQQQLKQPVVKRPSSTTEKATEIKAKKQSHVPSLNTAAAKAPIVKVPAYKAQSSTTISAKAPVAKMPPAKAPVVKSFAGFSPSINSAETLNEASATLGAIPKQSIAKQRVDKLASENPLLADAESEDAAVSASETKMSPATVSVAKAPAPKAPVTKVSVAKTPVTKTSIAKVSPSNETPCVQFPKQSVVAPSPPPKGSVAKVPPPKLPAAKATVTKPLLKKAKIPVTKSKGAVISNQVFEEVD